MFNDLVSGLPGNLFASVIWALIGLAGGWALRAWRSRRSVVPVRIQARKVVGPEKERTHPAILIATFSGYQRPPADMELQDFREALRNSDLNRLPLSEGTPSIGHTIRAIRTYESLKKVYLITTDSPQGHSSRESAPLLQKYVREVMDRSDCEVIADPRNSITLSEDNRVAVETYERTRAILEELRSQGLYRPKGSNVLVDVTGGVRAMSFGAAFACIRSDQDIHLIGSHYDDHGNPVDSFPMIVSFTVGRPE